MTLDHYSCRKDNERKGWNSKFTQRERIKLKEPLSAWYDKNNSKDKGKAKKEPQKPQPICIILTLFTVTRIGLSKEQQGEAKSLF